jgi:hypothetical protein
MVIISRGSSVRTVSGATFSADAGILSHGRQVQTCSEARQRVLYSGHPTKLFLSSRPTVDLKMGGAFP